MRWHLPPPRAVIALESVVRTGSVTAAAAELSVTHSAVSKQIALLEDWIGCPLFEPGRRQMIPTAAAKQLAEAAGIAWGVLAAAVDNVAKRAENWSLDVIAPATFAMRWLLPRLPDFHAGRTGVKVSVRQTSTPENWLDLPFDVAIRRGDPPAPRLATTTFLQEELVLVAAARSGLADCDSLDALPLLEADTRPAELTSWLSTARTWMETSVVPAQAAPMRFAHFYIALEAALQGQGALVAPRMVVQGLIEEGALTILFPQVRVPGKSYWIGFDPKGTKVKAAQQFSDWLLQMADCTSLHVPAKQVARI